MKQKDNIINIPDELTNAVQVIKTAIQQSQLKALRAINQEQLALYYGIGRYVSANTRNKNWGKGAIDTISEQLSKELPGLRGFSAPSLRKMRTFYEEWRMLLDNSFVETNNMESDEKDSFVPTNELPSIQFTMNSDFPIAAFLSIGFTHHYAIVSKVKDIEKRKFYIQFAADTKVKVGELEKFGEVEFPDLLFFNRELAALVCVELKSGPFKTAYLGQLAGYLRILDDEVRKPNENPSIGIILCKSANKKFVEYVIQDYNKPMGVATYKTTVDMDEKLKNLLPSIEELKKLL